MTSLIKIALDPQVITYAAALHPERRRAIKAALRELALGRGDHKALQGALAGFRRLRIGRYRIIYTFEGDGSIACLFLEDRGTIYKKFQPPAGRADPPIQ